MQGLSNEEVNKVAIENLLLKNAILNLLKQHNYDLLPDSFLNIVNPILKAS